MIFRHRSVAHVIGRFSFASAPSTSHILLELKWHNGERVGCIRAPKDILDAFGETLVMRETDEFVQFAFALGYAVTIASMTETPLTLTGDRSAWPNEFGDLMPRLPT